MEPDYLRAMLVFSSAGKKSEAPWYLAIPEGGARAVEKSVTHTSDVPFQVWTRSLKGHREVIQTLCVLKPAPKIPKHGCSAMFQLFGNEEYRLQLNIAFFD